MPPLDSTSPGDGTKPVCVFTQSPMGTADTARFNQRESVKWVFRVRVNRQDAETESPTVSVPIENRSMALRLPDGNRRYSANPVIRPIGNSDFIPRQSARFRFRILSFQSPAAPSTGVARSAIVPCQVTPREGRFYGLDRGSDSSNSPFSFSVHRAGNNQLQSPRGKGENGPRFRGRDRAGNPLKTGSQGR